MYYTSSSSHQEQHTHIDHGLNVTAGRSGSVGTLHLVASVDNDEDVIIGVVQRHQALRYSIQNSLFSTQHIVHKQLFCT